MKVALSASFYNFPEIQGILKKCDLIYTTQVENRDVLYTLFGKEKVFFIPTSIPSMINLIKEWHGKDTEYITYSDLFKVVNYETELPN